MRLWQDITHKDYENTKIICNWWLSGLCPSHHKRVGPLSSAKVPNDISVSLSLLRAQSCPLWPPTFPHLMPHVLAHPTFNFMLLPGKITQIKIVFLRLGNNYNEKPKVLLATAIGQGCREGPGVPGNPDRSESSPSPCSQSTSTHRWWEIGLPRHLCLLSYRA